MSDGPKGAKRPLERPLDEGLGVVGRGLAGAPYWAAEPLATDDEEIRFVP